MKSQRACEANVAHASTCDTRDTREIAFWQYFEICCQGACRGTTT